MGARFVVAVVVGVVLGATTSACAPPEAEPGIARAEPRRDGLEIFDGVASPGLEPGVRLGTKVVACPDGGFAAAAGGADRILFTPASPTPVRLPDSGTPAGVKAIACRQGPIGPQALASTGVETFVVFLDGGAVSFSDDVVLAFSVPVPGKGLPLLVARGNPLFLQAYGGTLPPTFGMVPPGARPLTDGGKDVALSPSWSGRVLVGLGTDQRALLLQWRPDAGFDDLRAFSSGGGTGSRFGEAVLQGDVAGTDDAEEYVVGAPGLGTVFVFQGDGGSTTLTGGPSFGASLALDPRDLGQGLHALWVGEPAAGVVHRFIGTDRLSFAGPTATPGMGFGAAIAVSQIGEVAVGAPTYGSQLPNEGAVFIGVNDARLPVGGVRASCATTTSCSLGNCQRGDCVGGLLCIPSMQPSGCGAGTVCDTLNDVCVPSDGGVDGGGGEVPDGGLPDAGVRDGGAPDAGAAADAGTPDGGLGLLVFQPSACSTSGALPLALLALTLLRPRARR